MFKDWSLQNRFYINFIENTQPAFLLCDFFFYFPTCLLHILELPSEEFLDFSCRKSQDLETLVSILNTQPSCLSVEAKTLCITHKKKKFTSWNQQVCLLFLVISHSVFFYFAEVHFIFHNQISKNTLQCMLCYNCLWMILFHGGCSASLNCLLIF